MRWYLFAMLSLMTAAAHGQAIYKCTQKDGGVAFQDSPCPGAPNASPMALASPNAAMPLARSYKSMPPASTASGRLSPDQARALIDQFIRVRQYDSAMALARRYGQLDYFSRRETQDQPGPLRPSLAPGAPQPQGGDLTPQQREQLKQFAQAAIQALSTKNSTTAPPGVSPDAHQVPWALVFITNADGSFSPRGPVRYNGMSYSGPTTKFTHQALFGGVDLTSMQGHGLWIHFDGRVLVIDKFQ